MNNAGTRKPMALLGMAWLILALIGCGGGLIRGQPPLVSISAVQLGEPGSGQIQALVDIHNPNGIEMDVSRFEMSMSLGDADLGLHSDMLGLGIHPNGTEEIRFDLTSDAAARDKLAELESGQRNSVPYSINGQVVDAQGESERFDQRGYLYPVPGRPGQFRGAGQQRKPPRDR